MKKIIINIILISAIFGTLLGILAAKIGDNKIKEEDYTTTKLNLWEEEIPKVVIKEYPKEEVLTTYKGYKVCAKLEIPSISLEAYILSEFSKTALNVSCTKFWGVEPNKQGNFCIAGHNIKSMFSPIKELDIGDTLYIIDNNVGRVEYEVFNIDKVLPADVDCLDAITENEKEVTLITCTNDSSMRVIVKAKEKEI